MTGQQHMTGAEVLAALNDKDYKAVRAYFYHEATGPFSKEFLDIVFETVDLMRDQRDRE